MGQDGVSASSTTSARARVEGADSESVDQLLEEGNAFEADV